MCEVERELEYREDLLHYYNCTNVILSKVIIGQYYVDNQINADSPELINFNDLVVQLRAKYPGLSCEEISLIVISIPSKYVDKVYFSDDPESDFPELETAGIIDFYSLLDLSEPSKVKLKNLIAKLDM